MKIKIKEFGDKPVTTGFFPMAGKKLLPGEEMEIEDEELLHQCLDTGLVEAVVERPRPEAKKPGRPKKVVDEEDPARDE